jgi:hypothetical protein
MLLYSSFSQITACTPFSTDNISLFLKLQRPPGNAGNTGRLIFQANKKGFESSGCFSGFSGFFGFSGFSGFSG